MHYFQVQNVRPWIMLKLCECEKGRVSFVYFQVSGMEAELERMRNEMREKIANKVWKNV